MKEYLNKLKDGTYKLVVLSDVVDGHDGLIEIPDGAEIYTKYDGSNEFYKSKNGIVYRLDGCSWIETNWESISRILKECDRRGFDVLWQRHTQSEELPFVDDESLNDQYAEIERVRQSEKVLKEILEGNLPEFELNVEQDNVNSPSHYKKGNVECIDAIQSSMTHDAFCGYLKGNIQKYIFRYEDKGGLESLLKAQWYLNKMIGIIECSKVKNSED